MLSSPHNQSITWQTDQLTEAAFPYTKLNQKLVAAETDRIRYARAIAADSAFGHEFNVFSDDEITSSGILKSFSQIRFSPDQTVRVHNMPHSENEEIPAGFVVEIIRTQEKYYEKFCAAKDDLEKLVHTHVLRAGTFEERSHALKKEVNSYSLKNLFEEFSQNPFDKLPRFSSDDADLKMLGNCKFSERLNRDIKNYHIYSRFGLCLPAIIAHIAVRNENDVRSWTKLLLDSLPNKSIPARIVNFILNDQLEYSKSKAELAQFTFRLITRFYGASTPSSCAPLAGQLLSMHKQGFAANIRHTLLE